MPETAPRDALRLKPIQVPGFPRPIPVEGAQSIEPGD